MEVLTQILQQGTEFDTLAETVLADRFERLVELVTMIGDKGELPIAMALANVVSPQYMVSFLIHFIIRFQRLPRTQRCPSRLKTDRCRGAMIKQKS
jgi:neurofibromin 1